MAQRGFGRYQARYRQIIPGVNQSLGHKDIGKVTIECCYLEHSTCGTLEQHHAWLLYLDINIHQPRGCRLSSADITLTFGKDTENIHVQQPLPTSNPRLGPQVTKYYGPKGFQDKPKEKNVTKERNLAPKIAALGNAGELGNIKKIENYTKSSRWKIEGQWKPVHDEQLGASLYRKVHWYVEEGTIDEQTLHSNSIHVGAILRHDLDPLCVEVRIEGKLQGLPGALRFPPWDKPAVVISKFTPIDESKPLDGIAKTLEDDLTKKNQIPVPEIGETVSAAGPSSAAAATDANDTVTPDPTGPTATTSGAVTASGSISPSEATPNTGANLISLVQSAVEQIAPVIQAVTGPQGTQNNTAA